jgi:methylaspartate ammonia-lyase
MDLSKAFDCLPHELLIANLHACGFGKTSLKVLQSYLSKRYKKTKTDRFLAPG